MLQPQNRQTVITVPRHRLMYSAAGNGSFQSTYLVNNAALFVNCVDHHLHQTCGSRGTERSRIIRLSTFKNRAISI